VAAHAGGGMPPGGERELLHAVQAPSRLLPAIGGVRIRFRSSDTDAPGAGGVVAIGNPAYAV
jgi:hypothetical protein